MSNPWSLDFMPPQVLDSSRVHIEPLSPVHTGLDYEAIMGSRDHLRQTLYWGDWPRANFTIQENRRDLQRHWDEFERREAYAYTVLTPDKKRCLGCIYMRPKEVHEEEGPGMSLYYWVVEEELAADLDSHLLSSVLEWVRQDWPFQTVVVPVRNENQRGAQVAQELGLSRSDQQQDQEDKEVFVWRRE